MVSIGFPKKVFSQSSAYKVLFLNSYNIGYAWSDSIVKGVKKSLNQKDIQLFIECLDAKRFGQEKFDVFSGYIRNKYKHQKFDVIIASDNDALDFVIKKGKKLFPKTPVVFCGISNRDDYKLEGTQIYGFTESNDPRETISVLTKLKPDAKSLLFITDNTTSGIIVIKEYEKLQKLYPYIKINIISEIDVDEILKTVQSGKNGDLVFVMAINRDKYGNLIDYLDLFRKIGAVSPNPVFVNDEVVIGNGIVGGNANRGFSQGYQSGQMALQLIKDTARYDLSHFNEIRDEYIFDYHLLKKYRINFANLPADSVIINKPMVHNLRFIVLLLVVILVLSAIVIVLTVNNRRRVRAEQKVTEQLHIINERNLQLEQSYTQLSDLNCELEEANAQLQSLNRSLEDAKLKAEESERLKSSFLANLSHEIRTPLNAILGFSSLLCDHNVQSNTKENYIKIIQSNSDSLLVLIDDILDLSKIEAGQIHINKEPVNLNQLLEELIEQFRQKCNSEVDLILDRNQSIQKIILYTDKIRFKQILINLLTNAFKFTETGSIKVGFELLSNSEMMFFVKDTGIGIDKKYHRAVFERFRKLEEETNKLYSGSGLGLAICKKLTELLGGKIWVEGEPGVGSTFYFTHPDYRVTGNSLQNNNIKGKNLGYRWNGNVIAVAEDEENNFLLLEQIITRQGAELIRFRDGLSIVKYFSGLEQHNIRLILMDIKMPGMDGFEAMEKIKQLFPDMVIIAQTAYAMGEEVKMIREKGFNDFITKPINKETLKSKLDKYMI
jgi:signal transduction histidine kinase